MKPVLFEQEALAELENAQAYYEKKLPGLGSRFAETVENGLWAIRRFPAVHPPHGPSGLRKKVLRQFPYTLFFLEVEAVIWIVAVAHQRRRPDYWKDRMSGK